MSVSHHVRLASGLILLSCAAHVGATSISQAKQIISAGLKDPSSVQFRDLKAFKNGSVCGFYNAKNGYGGYVGFVPFGVNSSGVLLDAPHVQGLGKSYADAAVKQFMIQCGN